LGGRGITLKPFLNFFGEMTTNPKKAIKLKSQSQLLKFLTCLNPIRDMVVKLYQDIEEEKEWLLRRQDSSCSPYPTVRQRTLGKNDEFKSFAESQKLEEENNLESVVDDLRNKLQQIHDVLAKSKISGLTRKLQMKPLEWVGGDDDKQGGPLRACRVQLILKWGGALTPLGEAQAKWLGESLRHDLYPDPNGGGVLRLHSTFRHDLKIKTSDEGRVMKTAAAFTKGMLELEGSLIPILVSLVESKKTDVEMLEQSGNKEVEMELSKCKKELNTALQVDAELTLEDISALSPAGNNSVRKALCDLGNPRRILLRMYTLIKELVEQLRTVSRDVMSGTILAPNLYMAETPLLMLDRWEKLLDDFYILKKGTFDLTKVPECHDMIRYDLEHNAQRLPLRRMKELYNYSKTFSDAYTAQEYGMTIEAKRIIGAKMCSTLLKKIKDDLDLGCRPEGGLGEDDTHQDMRYRLDPSHLDDLDINSVGRHVRTRLYFTSESHLHTLLNVLRYHVGSSEISVIDEQGEQVLTNTDEICYLTHIVIRVFEKTNVPVEDPSRFRVELSFSPGVDRPPEGLSDACGDPNRAGDVTTAPPLPSMVHVASTNSIKSTASASLREETAGTTQYKEAALSVRKREMLNKNKALTADQLNKFLDGAIEFANRHSKREQLEQGNGKGKGGDTSLAGSVAEDQDQSTAPLLSDDQSQPSLGIQASSGVLRRWVTAFIGAGFQSTYLRRALLYMAGVGTASISVLLCRKRVSLKRCDS